MRRILPAIVLVTVVATPAMSAPQIYLLRNVTMDGKALTVGAVAVVTGADKETVDAIRAVRLGRSPFPGEQIHLSPRTMLSRMAMSGINTRGIRFSGARQVRVTSRHQEITAERIESVALDELLACVGDVPGVTYTADGKVDGESINTSAGEVTLAAKVLGESAGPTATVVVSGTGEHGEKLFDRALTFRATYSAVRVVASRDLRPGELLDEDSITLETVRTPSRPRSQPSLATFMGSRTRSWIKRGALLAKSMVHMPSPEIIVERNNPVQMRISMPGMTVTAMGLALMPGREGDIIRVRNVDTMRIVSARVRHDGSVTPVLAK